MKTSNKDNLLTSDNSSIDMTIYKERYNLYKNELITMKNNIRHSEEVIANIINYIIQNKTNNNSKRITKNVMYDSLTEDNFEYETDNSNLNNTNITSDFLFDNNETELIINENDITFFQNKTNLLKLIEGTKQKVKNIIEDNSQLTNDIKNYKLKLKELSENNSKMNKNYELFNSKITEFESEKIKLEEYNNKLEHDIQNLTTKNSEITLENKTLTEENKQLNIDIEVLKKIIRELIEERDSK